jgi:Putative phage tail protein
MTSLFRNNTPVQVPATGVNFNSSLYGNPIPIVYGTTKVPGNLILYGNFGFITVSSPTSGGGGGGKGTLFGGGQSGSQFAYFAAFAFAVCEGPISGAQTLWTGQQIRLLASNGWTNFNGTYPQTAWGTTVTWNITDQFGNVFTNSSTPIGYNGIAYFAIPNFQLGNSTSIPNLQFEVAGVFAALGSVLDVNPADVLTDFLTNVHYGLGYPSAQIGDLSLWRNYCTATGFLVSPAYRDQRTASDMIDELMLATNSACFFSDGLLNVTPYGDQSIVAGSTQVGSESDVILQSNLGGSLPNFRLVIQVGNYKTYIANTSVTYTQGGGTLVQVFTPPWQAALQTGTYFIDGSAIYYFANGDYLREVTINYTFAATASYIAPITPLFALTDNDYLRAPQGNTGANGGAGGDGPLLMTRKRKSDRINSVKVEYIDRQNNYNPAIAYAENQAEIDFYGKRTGGTKTLHLFCNGTAANLSAHLQLRRELINNTYRFDLDQRYMLLDPMDIIEISDSNLGLVNQLVRVIEVNENDNQTLSFICEDALLGTGQAPAFSFGEQLGPAFTNINQTPGPIAGPAFFEPPFSLAGALEVAVAVGAPLTSFWGGADVWISTDGINYTLNTTIIGGVRGGVLTAPLASVTPAATGLTIDTLNTLSVDLTLTNGSIDVSSPSQAQDLAALIYVDGEYMSYGSAVLTGTNKYNITYLVRGLFGSTISAHATNSTFFRIDGHGIALIPYTGSRVGQQVYVKFLSFNAYGAGKGTLASANAYSYTILGTALAAPLADVTNVAAFFVGNIANIQWNEITDFRNPVYEIRVGSTFATAQFLARQAHPPFKTLGNGTYWIATYANPASGIVVYGPNPQSITISGTNITSNPWPFPKQEDPNWTGTLSGNIIKFGSVLETTGQGGGTYTIPTGDRITITAPVACAVIMQWTSISSASSMSIFVYKGTATITSGSAVVTNLLTLQSTAVLNGGSTVTGLSNTTSLQAGDPITGTGISTGTMVASILSSVSITMTSSATVGSTAVGSTQTLSFYPALVLGYVVQTQSTTVIPSGVTVSSLSTDPSKFTMSTTALTSTATSTIQISIDWTMTADFLGGAAAGNTTVLPYVRTSQDGGVTFSTFQQWVAGYYTGNVFDAQINLFTADAKSVAILEKWTFTVDVPDRVDHYPNLSLSSLGSTLVFRPDFTVTSTAPSGSTYAFNGGQDFSTTVTLFATPVSTTASFIKVTGLTLSQAVLTPIDFSGNPVGSTATILVEGY